MMLYGLALDNFSVFQFLKNNQPVNYYVMLDGHILIFFLSHTAIHFVISVGVCFNREF